MLRWLSDNHNMLLWLAGSSIVLVVAALLLVPAFLVGIPSDYFTHERRPPRRWSNSGPLARGFILVAKNVIGYVLIAMGAAMLMLPGPGMLVLLIGFLLVDFPGKYRIEKWLISRRALLGTINWIRQRRGCPPLQAASAHGLPA